MAPAVGDQRPVGGECSPRLRHRVVAHVVEDEVVALRALREVVLGVVDDVVSPDGADPLHVAAAAHAGHLGAERLGDLDGERAHATRRTIDEDLLARLNLAVVAEKLQRGGGGNAHGRGLLEGDVRWLPNEMVLGRGHVLGEGALAPAEDLVACSKSLHVLADRLDSPCDIGSRNADLGLA